MSNTSTKKKFSFGKLLIWAIVIFVALHIFTDGESTDSLMELFHPDEPGYTITDPTYDKKPQNTLPQQSVSIPSVSVPPATTLPAAPQPDRLPSVPEELRDHVYLNTRGWGLCEKLTGNVVITVIFVSDPDAAWSDGEINTVKSDLQSAVSRITSDAAGYGAQVNISLQYKTVSTSAKIVEGDFSNWADSALTSLGLPDRSKISSTLESTYGADSAPVIFIANHGGRAMATSFGAGNEYAVLYEDAHAFYHELSHIYGAKDFYYPANVKNLSETYLPNSIMVNSSEGVMEDFTAYLIGWTDTLSQNAMDFLKATAYLTQDYLSAEKEKETFTGYVTDFSLGKGTYTGYLVDGVRHGQGKYISSEGNTWEGSYVHGALQGQGTYVSATGNRYTGNFLNGSCHGQGTMVYSDGDIYEGQWSNNKRHGTGTYKWIEGSSYTGAFVENERTGQGTMVYQNGAVYKGQWLNGKRHGQGAYTDTDGSTYVGQWADNARSGQGTLSYANGNSYVGNWSNNTWNGQGTFTWTSGSKYVGAFVDGKRHGYGIYYYYNGDRYEGNWLGGNMHGQGTLYYANGTSKTGTWDNDNYVG